MLTLDFETYSSVDLKQRGLAAYAPNAEVLLCAYKLDDQPTEIWDVTTGAAMPRVLISALEDPDCLLLAHNAGFEKLILKHCLNLDLPWSRFADTMVLALTCGLPAGMDPLCKALNFDQHEAKLGDGKRLINLFSKPAPKNHKISRYTAAEKPLEWDRFITYCMRDVDVTRRLWDALPHWTYRKEQEVWQLDQTINDRGIGFDKKLASAAIKMLERELQLVNEELSHITEGAVGSASELAALTQFCSKHGVDIPSMGKPTVAKFLSEPLPPPVRRVLELRQRAGRTSVKKYEAGIQRETNGRIYNTLQFYGAGRTGRWAGRGFQPHNMARPSLDQDDSVNAIQNDTVDLLFEDPVAVASSAARAMIRAPKDYKLVVADLANIEGRVRAWLADEQWELEAYRQQDQGGTGVYEQSYAKAFNIDVAKVNKSQRQIGKVMELALGYQGGPAAFRTMAAAYGLDPADFVDPVRQMVARHLWDGTMRKYTKAMSYGLDEASWTALKIIVEGWRHAHPHTTTLWADIEHVAIAAVQKPETVMTCRRISWLCTEHDGRQYLVCKLPSGRLLNYFAPSCEMKTKTIVDTESGETVKFDKLTLSYGGMENHAWVRVDTYGGKLVENITQAVARDVLADGMLNAEQRGYAVVLTVHDEVVTEVPVGNGRGVDGLVDALCATPAWTTGLPLAASGYEDLFYRKD